MLARRYYLALTHFRRPQARPSLPGQTEVEAQSRPQALQAMLGQMEQCKASRKKARAPVTPAEVFVDPQLEQRDPTLHPALVDLSVKPPPLSHILGGAGRPPCDALCLLRAFLAAPLLGVGDDPTSVHRLLHSDPALAYLCGFLDSNAMKKPGDLTCRRLPAVSTCGEFSEVMTRYGLWHLARLQQVSENLATGVVETEASVSFDTTHVEANSHCGNVVPPDAKVQAGKKPLQRKVPRRRPRSHGPGGCARR